MALLREEVGGTFSERWYRVGPTRPKLSPLAQVSRHHRAGRVGYIIEDPASSKYFRLNESAYFLIGLLDGKRTVNDAWEACCAQLGDDAPTQRECIETLQRLQAFGLLHGEQPLAADMITERIVRARKARWDRRTGKWFFFNIPLVNPEPWLARHETLIRFLWSRWGLAVWLIVVFAAIISVVTHASELTSPLNEVFTPSRLMLIGVLFLFLRAAHELGHAMACKAMGGRCTEVGMIMIALVIPLPYCDASSAWKFPETWRRVVVSLGGVIVEMLIAGVCAVVWSMTSPEDAPGLRLVCYHTMLVSGVTTFLFNLNPLLRYDGYYILSDLADSPNLAQRSKEMWTFLVERIAFGLKGARPPRVRSIGEAWLLAIYGLLSTPYRWFIAISIVLLVSTKFLTLGLVIASITASIMLVWPVLKGIGYLASSPRLMGRRGRAVGVVGGMGLALVLALGAIPAPAASYAPAVIEPERMAVVRAPEEGFVEDVYVVPGQHVEIGQELFLLRNDELQADLIAGRARLDQARVQLDQARTSRPAEVVAAQRRVEVIQASVKRVERRSKSLVIRAQESGRFIPPGGASVRLDAIRGRFVPRGDMLGAVASIDALIILATVSDREQAYIFGGRDKSEVHATIRVRGRARYELPVTITHVAPSGSRTLSSPALSASSGGGIDIDPRESDGTRTLTPRFDVELTPTDPEAWARVGQLRAGARVRVRLGVDPEPLLKQWWRTGQRYIAARLSS